MSAQTDWFAVAKGIVLAHAAEVKSRLAGNELALEFGARDEKNRAHLTCVGCGAFGVGYFANFYCDACNEPAESDLRDECYPLPTFNADGREKNS